MAFLDTTSTGGGMPANSAPRKPRILLAASGSVAAIKFANLCHCFSEWAEVRAVATKASLHFIDRTSLPKDTIFYTDEDEWSSWKKIGNTVLHIDLRRWADIMVIAPLSANTLGKLGGGLCDNLLTCIVRAWDYSKPLFIAPAMNTFMWKNPFTERHLMTIDELGVTLIPPVSKRLACGDYGNGAMAEPSLIYSTDGSQMLFTSLNQITKEIEIRVARAIVSRADIDMDEIQKIFLKKYGIEIDETIRGRIVSGV